MPPLGLTQNGAEPLISSGVDQVTPPLVDMEPKIGEHPKGAIGGEQNRSFGSILKMVQVAYTWSRFGLFA